MLSYKTEQKELPTVVAVPLDPPTYEQTMSSILPLPSAPEYTEDVYTIDKTVKTFSCAPSKIDVHSSGATINEKASKMSSGPVRDGQHVTPEEKLKKFAQIISRYEISPFFAGKIRQLENYHIVYIVDDSGSMGNIVTDEKTTATSPRKTRWDEARDNVMMTVEIITLINSSGVDVYFLNRDPIFGVTDPSRLISIFNKPPEGGTPLGRVFKSVLERTRHILAEKKVLIITATDGDPNDAGLFESVLRSRSPAYKIPASFLLCTDENHIVDYWNNIDEDYDSVDVVDDYYSERKQILAVQERGFTFSRGDYMVKCLLGSIDSEIDKLDEERIGSSKKTNRVKMSDHLMAIV